MDENLVFQIREFGDGTWSVMVRVWTPQKQFYEHPTYINLPKEDAEVKCQELIKNPPKLENILKTWVFIGS